MIVPVFFANLLFTLPCYPLSPRGTKKSISLLISPLKSHFWVEGHAYAIKKRKKGKKKKKKRKLKGGNRRERRKRKKRRKKKKKIMQQPRAMLEICERIL